MVIPFHNPVSKSRRTIPKNSRSTLGTLEYTEGNFSVGFSSRRQAKTAWNPLYMLHRTVNACDLGSWSKLCCLRDFKKQSNRKPNSNGCALDTCPLPTTLRGNVVRNKFQIQWSPHISDSTSRQLSGSSFHITYLVFAFFNGTFSSPHVIHFGNLLSKLLG